MLSKARRCFTSCSLSSDLSAVDVHTHVYLPRYMNVLRSRKNVPRVISARGCERLIILPKEEEGHTEGGRPIGDEYWDWQRKIDYMDANHIQRSVISLANPWLDFLPKAEQVSLATDLNFDLQEVCDQSNGRLYGFGVIPQDISAALCELKRIEMHSKLRGIILSTSGMGDGLDHPSMLEVYEAVSKWQLFFGSIIGSDFVKDCGYEFDGVHTPALRYVCMLNGRMR